MSFSYLQCTLPFILIFIYILFLIKIIPPYLLWSREAHHFTKIECQIIKQYFYNEVESRITELIGANSPKNCEQYKINEDYNILKPVTENQNLLITAKPQKLDIRCQHLQSILLQATSLITLHKICTISGNDIRYSNKVFKSNGQVLKLPSMPTNNFSTKNFSLQTRHLKKIATLHTEIRMTSLLFDEYP